MIIDIYIYNYITIYYIEIDARKFNFSLLRLARESKNQNFSQDMSKAQCKCLVIVWFFSLCFTRRRSFTSPQMTEQRFGIEGRRRRLSDQPFVGNDARLNEIRNFGC